MVTASAPRPRPVVALEVEPRLLRDALARALDEEGITIVDLRDGARCDILLASQPPADTAQAPLVVPVGADGSTEAGLLGVADLLDVIHRWETEHRA